MATEREFEDMLIERDYWENKLYDLVNTLGGDEVGEWSNMNDPADNLIELIQAERTLRSSKDWREGYAVGYDAGRSE